MHRSASANDGRGVACLGRAAICKAFLGILSVFAMARELAAQQPADPCTQLAPYLVDVHQLQTALSSNQDSSWLNILDNYQRANSYAEGNGGINFFGLGRLGAEAAQGDSREMRAMAQNSGSLTTAMTQMLKEYTRTASKSLEKLVENCTGRRDVSVLYVVSNPYNPKQFTIHITFDPSVGGIETSTARLRFSDPVSCNWDTKGTWMFFDRATREHDVPVKRPNGAIGQCRFVDSANIQLGASVDRFKLINESIVLGQPPQEPVWRWAKSVKGSAVDGRYTAYIEKSDDGSVVSSPLDSWADSHVGYVFDIPRDGDYLLVVDYSTDVESNVEVRQGAAYTRVMVKQFHPSQHPSTAQAEKVAVLELKKGSQLIDFGCKDSAGTPVCARRGLPRIHAVTLVALTQ